MQPTVSTHLGCLQAYCGTVKEKNMKNRKCKQLEITYQSYLEVLFLMDIQKVGDPTSSQFSDDPPIKSKYPKKFHSSVYLAGPLSPLQYNRTSRAKILSHSSICQQGKWH